MTAHDAFEPVEPIALQAAWGARLTPGAPPIRHAAPPSPLSSAETVQHDELSGEVTAELPLLLNPQVAPPTYKHSELAWFEAALSLAPAAPRVEAPTRRRFLPVLAGLGLVTVTVMTASLVALAWLLPH